MYKLAPVVNEDGFFIEDTVVDSTFNEIYDNGDGTRIISTPVPEGLFNKPRWAENESGICEWVEGLTEEELSELERESQELDQPKPFDVLHNQIEILLTDNEILGKQIVQNEIDKIKQQVHIDNLIGDNEILGQKIIDQELAKATMQQTIDLQNTKLSNLETINNELTTLVGSLVDRLTQIEMTIQGGKTND